MSIVLLSDTQRLNTALHDRLSSEIRARGNRIVYISSSPQSADRPWFHKTGEEYDAINAGSTLTYFDLGDSFTDIQLESILDFGTVHLSGGNTYAFQDAINKRNFKRLLEKHIVAGGLIVGVSAGAIVLTPHIGTSIFCLISAHTTAIHRKIAPGFMPTLRVYKSRCTSHPIQTACSL